MCTTRHLLSLVEDGQCHRAQPPLLCEQPVQPGQVAGRCNHPGPDGDRRPDKDKDKKKGHQALMASIDEEDDSDLELDASVNEEDMLDSTIHGRISQREEQVPH